MRFQTTVLLGGKTATGLLIPPEVVSELGGGKKPAVTVRLNGYTYRSTIAARGDQFLIPVSAEVRTHSGVAAGDEVEVDLELDLAPREVLVPEDFAERLDQEPQARTFFDSLSYSHRLALVLPIEQAKTAETRGRRIDKAVDTLRQGRAR